MHIINFTKARIMHCISDNDRGWLQHHILIMDRSWKPKLNRYRIKLTAVIDHGITDIKRIFHPKTEEYTFFSAQHGTCSKVDNPLDYKTSFNWHKKIEIIESSYWITTDKDWSSIATKAIERPHKHIGWTKPYSITWSRKK